MTSGSGNPMFSPGRRIVTMISPMVSDIKEAVINQPMVLAPTRPNEPDDSPIWVMPTISVDITSGNFVFSASESYLIEDGKLTRPVRNATLIGNGPEAMKHVSMVGHDLRLDEGIGVCGKEGQSVPVGVGIPTVRIDRMTVGGTA